MHLNKPEHAAAACETHRKRPADTPCSLHGLECKEPPRAILDGAYRDHIHLSSGSFGRVYASRYFPAAAPQTGAPPDPNEQSSNPSGTGTKTARGFLSTRGRGPGTSTTQIPTSPQAQPPRSNYCEMRALKVMSKCTLGTSAAARAALRSEVEIQRALKHPNIVSLRDVHQDHQRVYLVMDLVPGPTLAAYIEQNGPLPEASARTYFTQLCRAVQYLHAQSPSPVLHRDIKPDNILLSADHSTAYLCDFGLSQRVAPNGKPTTLAFVGTPNFLPPELLNINADATPDTVRPYTHQCPLAIDSWAAGCVLFLMLFGMAPFDGVDISRTFRRIRAARIHFPSDVKVSAQARALIRALLAKQPTSRPSMDAVLDHPFVTGGTGMSGAGVSTGGGNIGMGSAVGASAGFAKDALATLTRSSATVKQTTNPEPLEYAMRTRPADRIREQHLGGVFGHAAVGDAPDGGPRSLDRKSGAGSRLFGGRVAAASGPTALENTAGLANRALPDSDTLERTLSTGSHARSVHRQESGHFDRHHRHRGLADEDRRISNGSRADRRVGGLAADVCADRAVAGDVGDNVSRKQHKLQPWSQVRADEGSTTHHGPSAHARLNSLDRRASAGSAVPGPLPRVRPTSSSTARCLVLYGNMLHLLNEGLRAAEKTFEEDDLAGRPDSVAQARFVKVANRMNMNDPNRPILVDRWLDATSTHGFATMLSDGRAGCCFNDSSIMFYWSTKRTVPDVTYTSAADRHAAALEAAGGNASSSMTAAALAARKRYMTPRAQSMTSDESPGASAKRERALQAAGDIPLVRREVSPGGRHRNHANGEFAPANRTANVRGSIGGLDADTSQDRGSSERAHGMQQRQHGTGHATRRHHRNDSLGSAQAVRETFRSSRTFRTEMSEKVKSLARMRDTMEEMCSDTSAVDNPHSTSGRSSVLGHNSRGSSGIGGLGCGGNSGDGVTSTEGASTPAASTCSLSFLGEDKQWDDPSCTESLLKIRGVSPSNLVHVREWQRYRNPKAVAFRLSNDCIHVKIDIGSNRRVGRTEEDFLLDGGRQTIYYRGIDGHAWECDLANLSDFCFSRRFHQRLSFCSCVVSRFIGQRD